MTPVLSLCTRPLAILLLLAGIVTAQTQSPAAIPESAQSDFQKWLREAHLVEHLDFQKLRRISTSSVTKDDPAKRSLQLALLFLTDETEETKAVGKFVDLLNQYQVTNGVSLPETIFYKLIQTCDWPRADAVVEIFVLEDTFAVYLDSATRQVVIREINQRDSVRQPITLPLTAVTASSGPGLAVLKGAKPTDPNTLARKIEGFFENYFVEANRKAQLHDPQFSPEPIEADYVGLKVAGVKRQVLPSDNYWEKITISVEIKSVPEGQKLVCYLSGKYASGLFGRLPSDNDYADIEESKLRSFTGTILRRLQDYFAAGAP